MYTSNSYNMFIKNLRIILTSQKDVDMSLAFKNLLPNHFNDKQYYDYQIIIIRILF